MALLATLSRLLRRTPPPAAEVLEAYAHVVIPVLDRAEWLYQYWLEQSTLFTHSETPRIPMMTAGRQCHPIRNEV